MRQYAVGLSDSAGMPLSDDVSVHSQTIVFPLSYYFSVLSAPPPESTVQSHSLGTTCTLFVSSVLLCNFGNCWYLIANSTVAFLRRCFFGTAIQDCFMIALRFRYFGSGNNISNFCFLTRAGKGFRGLTQR